MTQLELLLQTATPSDAPVDKQRALILWTRVIKPSAMEGLERLLDEKDISNACALIAEFDRWVCS